MSRMCARYSSWSSMFDRCLTETETYARASCVTAGLLSATMARRPFATCREPHAEYFISRMVRGIRNLSDRLALGGGALHEQRYQFDGLPVRDLEVSRLGMFRASGKALREPIGRLSQRDPFSLREGLKVAGVHIPF